MDTTTEQGVIVRKELVVASWSYLRQQKIHPNFVGYLCVKQASIEQAPEKALKPDFKAFFERYLRMAGAPARLPYAFPFSESEPSESNKWFNRNVAGSYAPSSIRQGSPFRKSVDVSGTRQKAAYTLLPSHWLMAKKYLLYGSKLRAFELAAFLYRDYAVISPSPEPSDLLTIFRAMFGYRQEVSQEQSEFAELFDPSTTGWSASTTYEALK